MHDFVTLFIANSENTGSLSISVLSYVDTFQYKIFVFKSHSLILPLSCQKSQVLGISQQFQWLIQVSKT